jgi:glycerol-1-phosphate dehydrogenase [NAD(P)+]
MTLAGTSFPASGGEHLVSHVLDMTAGLDGIEPDYHGRQVGLGTIVAAALYERLLEQEPPCFEAITETTDTEYWRELAPVVEEEHAGKRRRTRQAVQRLREPGVWDKVRAVIAEADLSAARIKDCLRRAGGAHRLNDIGCDRDRFMAALLHCHQIRERFTVVDLARAAGVLPAAAEDIVDEYLA